MNRSCLVLIFSGLLVRGIAACSSPQPPATPAPTLSAPPPASASTSAPAAPASTAPPSAASEVPTKELIGTWEYQGAKLTLNSKGRARMHFGDPPCLGSYSFEGNRMMIKYDPDTKACTWKSPERVRVQGNVLDVGPVTYKRVDARDDTSF